MGRASSPPSSLRARFRFNREDSQPGRDFRYLPGHSATDCTSPQAPTRTGCRRRNGVEPPQFGGWRHRIAQVMPQPVGTASASPNPIGSFKSKMALTRDDIADREFDWFLVDGDGHVALCASGGYGPIPAWVLQHSDPDDTPDDHREELLQCLPEVGDCRVEGEVGWCEEWLALARRGFYIYDWRLWHGPYQRIVRQPFQSICGNWTKRWPLPCVS